MTQELSAVDRLIALAGVTRVEKHKRTTKTGKVVDVESHLRSVRSMPNMDLFSEYTALGSKTDPQSKNRKTQVVNEIRKRQKDGSWQASKDGGAKTDAPEKADAPEAPNKPKSLTEGLDTPEDAPEAGSNAVRKLQQTRQDREPSKPEAPEAKPGTDKPAKKTFTSRTEHRVKQPLDEGTLADFNGAPSSASQHLVEDPETGEVRFSEERQKLHRQIIDELLEGFESQENPKFHVMGGGPASGKSVMEKANPEISEGHALLNPDDIKEKLPEYHNRDGSKNAAFAHEESSYLAKQAQAEGFHRRVNMTLDGTGNSSAKKMRSKIAPAREAGYEVNAYYVSVDTDTAVERAMSRGRRTGRFVPEKVVRGTHIAVSETFPLIMGEFDNAKLYDTSGGGEPVLVGDKVTGERFKVQDRDAWKRFLAKAGEVAER